MGNTGSGTSSSPFKAQQPNVSSLASFLRPQSTEFIGPPAPINTRKTPPVQRVQTPMTLSQFTSQPQSSGQSQRNLLAEQQQKTQQNNQRILDQQQNKVTQNNVITNLNLQNIPQNQLPKGRIAVETDIERNLINQIRIEQLNKNLANQQQKQRVEKIRELNFGQSSPLLTNAKGNQNIADIINENVQQVKNPIFTFGKTQFKNEFGSGTINRAGGQGLSNEEIQSRINSSNQSRDIIGEISQRQTSLGLTPLRTQAILPSIESDRLLNLPQQSNQGIVVDQRQISLAQLSSPKQGLITGLDAKTQPRALSVFGGQPTIIPFEFPNIGKGAEQVGFEVSEFGKGFVAGGQNLISSVVDIGLLGRNAFANAIDPDGNTAFRVTKDAEGNILEIDRGFAPNPIPRISTPIATLEDTIFDSAFATESIQGGILKGLPAFGTSERAGEIFNTGLIQTQTEFEKRKSFGAGASIFGALELVLPFSKAPKGAKVISSPAFISGLGDMFKGLFDKSTKVVGTAPKKVPKDLFFGMSDSTKKLRLQTDLRSGDSDILIKNAKGDVIGLKRRPTETLSSIKSDMGVAPPELGDDPALILSRQLEGLPKQRIGSDQLSTELGNIGKGLNVDNNIRSMEIKKISQSFKNKNNPFGRTDKDSMVKGISRDEAERIFDLRQGTIQATTKAEIKLAKKSSHIDSIEGTFLDTNARGGNILTGSFARNIDDVSRFAGAKQTLKFIDDASISGKGNKFRRSKQLFDEPKPKKTATKTINKKPTKRPSLKEIGIGAGISTGIGASILLNENNGDGVEADLASRFDLVSEKDRQKRNVVPILINQTEEIQIQATDEKQQQKQRYNQIFSLSPTQPSTQTPAIVGNQIPKLGLLEYENYPRPFPIFDISDFQNFPEGGSGGQDTSADRKFFRVFAVAEKPFAKTTLPLGEFVDSDREISEITDVLSRQEIFRENRIVRNPLRSPKNISESGVINDLFGFDDGSKKKKNKRSDNLFDSSLFKL